MYAFNLISCIRFLELPVVALKLDTSGGLSVIVVLTSLECKASTNRGCYARQSIEPKPESYVNDFSQG